MSTEHVLVPLVERQDLGQKCIELLNEEWPRSDGARAHSQKKSCRDAPPMSFLLIEKSSDRLVGHARVCRLPNRTDACWVESVIISKSERGRGLGKILMQMVETYVPRFGFSEAYLSTDDKVEFYRRCGYSECEPVLHSTSATSVFPVILTEQSTLPPKKAPTAVSLATNCSGAPPAPPPPPKKDEPKNKDIATVNHQYMHKMISI